MTAVFTHERLDRTCLELTRHCQVRHPSNTACAVVAMLESTSDTPLAAGWKVGLRSRDKHSSMQPLTVEQIMIKSVCLCFVAADGFAVAYIENQLDGYVAEPTKTSVHIQCLS